MKMTDCPKYDRCSAAICPLDKDWAKRNHAKGDSTCIYMLEARKDSRNEVFIGQQGEELMSACNNLFAELEQLNANTPMGAPRGMGELLIVLREAAKSGSRILGAQRMRC